jgi:hypothetical protein
MALAATTPVRLGEVLSLEYSFEHRMSHVVLVLEEAKPAKVLSFWNAPQGKPVILAWPELKATRNWTSFFVSNKFAFG